MSLLARKINVQFQLGQGSFGESGFNTVELTGLRCQVAIERAGLPFASQATARIYGMPPSLMNQLSTLGGNPVLTGRLNLVTIFAGDDVFGMNQIFQGIVQNGWQDYDHQPDTAFMLQSVAGGLDLVKPASPTSYSGTSDVATIMQSLAARMTPPLAFANYDVVIKITAPYLCGTIMDQIRVVAKAANINAEIYGGELAIWPRNGRRPIPAVTVSPDFSMVGYPSFNGAEIVGLRTIFMPTLHFGAQIQVESSIQPACGTWYVSDLNHFLESQTENGDWQTEMSVMSWEYFSSQPQS